jgi:hypothetical protein
MTSMTGCPDCGHTHEGPGLAGICVGCPCPYRPAERGLTVDQVEFARRVIVTGLAKADAGTTGDVYSLGLAYAYRHTLYLLDVLLAEADRTPAGSA